MKRMTFIDKQHPERNGEYAYKVTDIGEGRRFYEMSALRRPTPEELQQHRYRMLKIWLFILASLAALAYIIFFV